MVRHNNVVPNQHFKKKWQLHVRTWFNQPARKLRRRNARVDKAAKVFPRPVKGALRPVVRGQTVRYNLKKRFGRGFTFEELKEAGIPRKAAPTIGIAVDHRRRNRSLESLQENVNRLKAYKASLVVFPRRSNKPKAGDTASKEEREAVPQALGRLQPIAHAAPAAELETAKITEEMQAFRAYYKLRLERTNKKHLGKRAKRAAEAAAEEKDKAKPREEAEQPAERDEKRPRTEEPLLQQPVVRPGVPAPTDTRAFVVPDRPSPPFREDSKDGHFVYELGDNMTSRYKILSKMGEGTFGRVLECWDRKNKDYVAIKIVRNVQKYRDAAMIELEVLNTLERNDPEGRYHCVSLREWFDYRDHVCMVFEKLGLSLYDFLRKNSYSPFPAAMVRAFGRQLLEAVAYLHEVQLVHTDLKPENILLASLEYSKLEPPVATRRGRATARRVPCGNQIRVIDFGSATFEDQYHSSIVSTRHYRAPEVVLGLGWSFPCDLWSVGCILVELATGDALFQTHENLEHLAMMEAVLGPLPEHLARAANRQAAKYFTPRHRLNWPEGAANRRSAKAVAKMTGLAPLLSSLGEESLQPLLPDLLDLLSALLRYDPAERISARAALRHAFFTGEMAPASNGALSASAGA
ncbi:hypothetical protein WJX81_002518 [Elliptochloris bilobata]|uniref:60S ribosomal protein L13 n=1 Tax=Elliptochloris bilobata TaxID=381761 RepID=A0AAW1QLT6_9CHLO